jgi:adenine-specific DNA-methyltransferase
MTFCPGKKQRNSHSGHWDRDLVADLGVIKDWGAEALVARAKGRDLPPAEIRFDYGKHVGKISRVEPLIGRSGWLTLCAFSVESVEQSEDHLIFAAATDDGEPLDPETAARLMTLPGTVSPLAPYAGPGARQEQLAVQIAEQRGTIERGISERNARYR